MKISDHLKADVERHSKKNEEKKSSHKESRKVKRFTVTPADDKSGYHVETDYQEPMGKGGALYSEYGGSNRETSVHKSLSSVHKHMKDCCGTVEGAE